VAVDRDVGPSPGADRQVALQHRRPVGEFDLVELHAFAAAVAQHGPALGGPHVVHPPGAVAEHRHQIAPALVLGERLGERDRAAIRRAARA
jgi:hypothetical protein